MQFLVYEFATGGGAWSYQDGSLPAGALLREGAYHGRGAREDLCRMPRADVIVMRDSRLRHLAIPGRRIFEIGNADAELMALLEIGSRVDGVFLIAPEMDGLLLERCQLIENAGGKLFSPSSDVVALCSDKHRTAIWLAERGIRSPTGQLLTDSEQIDEPVKYPAIIKPVDGCGSIGVRLVQNEHELQTMRQDSRFPLRIEEFCPGVAVSVSILCGSDAFIPLPAATQSLATDGTFAYLGGQIPLAPEMNDRAQSLALRAVKTLPKPVGYIGIDLVLGDATDGADDVVIEINPRLTTSYVGLRRMAQGNLAEALVQLSMGQKPELSFESNRLEFTSSGETRWL